MSADKKPLVGNSNSEPPYGQANDDNGPQQVPPPYNYGSTAQDHNTNVVNVIPSPRQQVPVWRDAPIPQAQTSPQAWGIQKPPNYIVFSIINMILCCFLFGVIALIIGIQSDAAWARGDLHEAQLQSKRALGWNLAGIVVGAILLAASIIVTVVYAVTGSFRLYPAELPTSITI